MKNETIPFGVTSPTFAADAVATTIWPAVEALGVNLNEIVADGRGGGPVGAPNSIDPIDGGDGRIVPLISVGMP